MMGLAGRHPYPRDELRRMWREDAAGCVVGETLLRQFLHFVLATSALSQEELLELALETGLVNQEVKMNVIIQPLILDAFKKGMSEGVEKVFSKGRSEGRSEGMSALLLSLVRERFGPVPEVIAQKVRSATPSDLEAWAMSFVHARSLDDVFGNTPGTQNGRLR